MAKQDSSARAFDERGWGAGRSVGRLWGDVWAQVSTPRNYTVSENSVLTYYSAVNLQPPAIFPTTLYPLSSSRSLTTRIIQRLSSAFRAYFSTHTNRRSSRSLLYPRLIRQPRHRLSLLCLYLHRHRYKNRSRHSSQNYHQNVLQQLAIRILRLQN